VVTKDGLAQHSGGATQPPATSEADGADAQPTWVVHAVTAQDSLVALSLHYGCSVNAIVRANQLGNLGLHSRSCVRIPCAPGRAPKPQQAEEALALLKCTAALRRLRERCWTELKERITQNEALLYLSETEGQADCEAAFVELRADIEWERGASATRRVALRRVAAAQAAEAEGSDAMPGRLAQDALHDLKVPLLEPSRRR
jgi:hypothetical protein